jgi:hypothetical protein
MNRVRIGKRKADFQENSVLKSLLDMQVRNPKKSSDPRKDI